MPHLNLPDPDRPSALRAIYYRRTLHRGQHWHAVELADGELLILRRPVGKPRRRLSGDAATDFRKRLYSAQMLDLADGDPSDRRRAERVCAALCDQPIKSGVAA